MNKIQEMADKIIALQHYRVHKLFRSEIVVAIFSSDCGVFCEEIIRARFTSLKLLVARAGFYKTGKSGSNHLFTK